MSISTLVDEQIMRYRESHFPEPVALVLTAPQRSALLSDPRYGRQYISPTASGGEQYHGLRLVVATEDDDIAWVAPERVDIRAHGIPRDLDQLESDIRAVIVGSPLATPDTLAISVAAVVRGRLK